jgi:hypothetical protein
MGRTRWCPDHIWGYNHVRMESEVGYVFWEKEQIMLIYIFGLLTFLMLSAEVIYVRNTLILKHYVQVLEIIKNTSKGEFDELIKRYNQHSQMWDVFNLSK